MGFLDRFRRNAAEQEQAANAMPTLPALNLEEASFRTGSGYFAAKLLSRLGQSTVAGLAEVRNVSREDVLALIQSIQGSWRLAVELTAVEAEIDRASNGELHRYLSEDQYWCSDGRWRYDDYTPHYHGQQIEWFQSIECYRQKMTEWIEDNVGEPQLSDFLKLLERQAELRAAVIKASITFDQTRNEITEAVRKSRIIAASEQINGNVGEMARPELEVENATTALGLVGAVSDGLDEAYFDALGKQPELGELDEVDSAVQPEIDPASWSSGQVSL